MLLRICSAAILASLASMSLLAGSAQAQSQLPLDSIQIRSLYRVPEPRDEFVRQCAYRLIWILGWAVIVILHPGRSGCGRSPAIEVIFSEIQFGE